MKEKYRSKAILFIGKAAFLLRNHGKAKIWELKKQNYYMPLIRYTVDGGGDSNISLACFNTRLLRNIISGELNKKVLALPRVTFCITTKCTLKCQSCGELIPYFKEKKDIDVKSVINDIKAIENKVNDIYCVGLIGGEPFLHKDIKDILHYAVKSAKIHKIELTTNGMVCLSDELLKELANPKVTVVISDYSAINREYIIRLIKTFKKRRVKYRIDRQKNWWDFGLPENYNRTKEQNDIYFNNCYAPGLCRSVYKGNFMICTRGAWLLDEGIIIKDFVNVHAADFGPEKLYEFYYAPRSDLCNYCNYKQKKIKVAKQL